MSVAVMLVHSTLRPGAITTRANSTVCCSHLIATIIRIFVMKLLIAAPKTFKS